MAGSIPSVVRALDHTIGGASALKGVDKRMVPPPPGLSVPMNPIRPSSASSIAQSTAGSQKPAHLQMLAKNAAQKRQLNNLVARSPGSPITPEASGAPRSPLSPISPTFSSASSGASSSPYSPPWRRSSATSTTGESTSSASDTYQYRPWVPSGKSDANNWRARPEATSPAASRFILEKP